MTSKLMARLPFVLQQEGGFSDDPLDPGGATEAGITLTNWRAFSRCPAATIAQLRALTASQEAAFYGAMFWNPLHGDALPSGVDLMVMDEGVNTGVYRSASILQHLVAQEEDGWIGPLTLSAVALFDADELIDALSFAQEAFYRDLPGFTHDGAGWLARLGRRTAASHALVDVS